MSKPEYVYDIYIQTTPEKVWDALQDPEMTKETGKALTIPMAPPHRMLDALKQLGIKVPGM